MKQFLYLLAGISLITSCATAPAYEPYTYSGDKLFYPAVREAIYTNIKEAAFDSVDIYNNKFLIKDVGTLDGLTPRLFDIAIDTAGGTVKYKLDNIRLQDSKTKVWKPNSVFLLFSPNTLFAKLDKTIAAVMGDDAAYEASKKAALSDQLFLFATIKDLNEVARKSFIQKELGSLAVEISGTVIDVQEAPTTLDGTEYKYKVTFSQNIGELKGGSLYSSFLTGGLYYRLHTNEISFSTYNRGANIKVLAKIVDGSKSLGMSDFFFTVVTAN